MEQTKLAVYKTSRVYSGHSRINRYHWEVCLECYKIDYSEERSIGILINGHLPSDTFEIWFTNYKGDVVRKSKFSTRKEANDVVLRYINCGFRKEAIE